MADKLRVHTLSKELGVTSKAILQKCKLEGVEGVTNHMSTVSAGLAETIREWFGEEHHGTAVETSAPVDLEKVRAKRKTTDRRRKKKEGEEEAAGGVATEEHPESAATPETPTAPEAEESAVESAPAEPAVAEGHETPDAEPAAEPEPPSEPVSAPEVVFPETPAPAGVEAEPTTGGEPAAPAEPGEAPSEEPPQVAAEEQESAPPEPLAPAGPQNVPAPATMKGPQVIGFAKPDPVQRPVPRSRPPAGPQEPGAPGEAAGGARRGAGRTAAREDDAKRSRGRTNPRRSRGSTVAEAGERLREWRDRDLLERQERLQTATGRGIHARRARERSGARGPGTIAPRKTSADVSEPVILHELCSATGIGMNQLFPKFKKEHNMFVNRNSVVPNEIAELVMLDFGVELKIVKPKTEYEKLTEEFDQRERKDLRSRPPVVTMLGHVDHGKTSLLDAIRKTAVASGEAGGITQHIGAYRVEHGDLSVTFLDTPGHAAFTSMRARGANMTDVVVLVVAADDGIMPQTIEAINHAKAAGVNIVVALNKIDLPGVDLNKVYGQLAERELTPTEWGGETDVIKTSATTGEGIQELVAHLSTLSELLELKADPTVPASGVVVEGEMRQGVGSLARLLVKEGTLKRGDFLVCGAASGRVRDMKDDKGKTLKSAGPSMPVEVTGLDGVPNAGDLFFQVSSLQRAKDISSEVGDRQRQEQLVQVQKVRTLDDLFKQRESGEIPELNLILRADVQGSLDALVSMLQDIPSDEVKLNFLHTGIGGITESDIVLAAASGAMVVGFSVAADPGVQRLADAEGVSIRLYRVIYEVADDIRKALEGLLPKDQSEEFRGRAEVREVFNISRLGTIAGCIVNEGVIGRHHKVRVVRDGQIVIPTADDAKRNRHRAVESLKRFKDDAREVRAGQECGIRVESFDDLKPGDMIEAYDLIETARTLG